MEVTELKAQIQSKQFNPFYIFAGVEWKVQRIYIDQIAKTSGKELAYVDSIADVYSKLGSRSFLSKSHVYVIRDDKDLMQNEKLQSELYSAIGDSILILILSALDKRLKFYKTYKDMIIDFEPLKPQVLKKYIQKEINLSDKNCDKLMEVCEYDYGRCLLEIDKIASLVMSDVEGCYYDPDIAFEELLKSGVIYQPPKDAIFDFVDAVLDNKVNLAYDLYRQCIEVGEATMVMLSVLYSNARAVLQVQGCHTSDVAKATGLTSWQIMNAKKHQGVYSVGQLLNILDVCQQCQEGIVSGTLDEEFTMDYLLTSIM